MLTIMLITVEDMLYERISRGYAYNYADDNSTYTVKETVEDMLTIMLMITLLTLLKKQ